MKNLLFALLSLLATNFIYSQSDVDKKIILLEYQVKELKEQNEKLTERLIALELRLKSIEESGTTQVSGSSTSTPSLSKSKTIPKAATNNRCTAITQAGTQCKRNAQAGRDKCWQH